MKKKKSGKVYIESRFQLFGSLGPEIRVMIPTDWVQDSMPGMSVPGANAVFRPAKAMSAIFSSHLSLFASYVNPKMSFKDYRKYHTLDLKEKVAGFRLLNERKTELAGLPAHKLTFLSKVRDFDIKWLRVMAVGQQAVFYFTFGQDTKNFSNDSKAALDILKKVEIIEKVKLRLPDNAYILTLIQRTNKLIIQGVKKKDFSLLYRTMDPDFKKEYPVDSFCNRFRDYWEKKDIIESLASKKPIFDYPPAIDLNNKLSISVYYSGRERELHLFELFSYRNRKWTLFNIIPSIKEIK